MLCDVKGPKIRAEKSGADEWESSAAGASAEALLAPCARTRIQRVVDEDVTLVFFNTEMCCGRRSATNADRRSHQENDGQSKHSPSYSFDDP